MKESSRISCALVGVRGFLLISCVPIAKWLPLLNTLSGLDDNECSKFKEFVQERIEKITPE